MKTSILILDKSLAKASDTIAFFKVENDGFGLGAQRRAISGEQLTTVQAELAAYLQALRAKQPTADLQAICGLIVPKKKIAANGDYNLSGERYRDGNARASFFPNVPLGEVCKLIGGATPSKQDDSYWTNGSVKWISSKHIDGRGLITAYELISKKAVEETSTRVAPKGSTIIITRVSVGKFAFADDDYAINQDLTALVSKDYERLAPEFIGVAAHHIAEVVERNAEGMGVRGVTRSFLSELQIPLPPLEVQKEIVAEIEGYQKVINGARAVLDHYRPHIPIHPDWPMVGLADVFKLSSGRGLTQSNMKEGPYLVYGGNGKTGTHSEYFMENPNIVIGRVGAYCGAVHITEPKAWITDNALYITEFKQEIDLEYLAQALVQLNLNQFAKVGGQPSISQTTVYERAIALPPLATQQDIVAEIEAEQALVAANSELVTRFEKKIQATLARIWGEEAPAAAEA